MADIVNFQLRDGIATLTMDDGKANALSLRMSQAIDTALDQAERENARAVVIRGRTGILGGGFDLNVIRSGDAAARAAMTDSGMRLLARLYLLPQPLIIACTGHAVAAGCLMLLTGDVRIGVHGAFRIGLNETGIGLSLPQAGIELARDRLLPTALTDAVLLARLYGPEDAVRVGYLERAVDAADLDAAVAEAAETLAKLDPTAFATTKRRLRQASVDRAPPP
ncbi:MAG: crotonase/enoyl-CoA hydratase family protein [Acetobacteraceae bacterium]